MFLFDFFKMVLCLSSAEVLCVFSQGIFFFRKGFCFFFGWKVFSKFFFRL